MIQPLRRVHFRTWIALAIVLVALFVSALAVRPVQPRNPNLHWESLK